jgi:hypothetical protein
MVNCPLHEDRHASMKIYGPVAYCFVCCMSIPTDELKLPSSIQPQAKQIADVGGELEKIKTYPVKRIRGLELPEDPDGSGYYIVWPNGRFFKKRKSYGSVRYLAPAGHKVPLYVCPGDAKHLLVIEGELNAASLFHVLWEQPYKITSPGSAGEFLKQLDYYLKYDTITLILDKDAAGIVHGIHTKEILLKHRKNVKLVLVDHDFNEKLQESEEALKKYFWEVI